MLLLVLRRLRKSPSAMAGGIIVLAFVLVALLATVYTPFDPVKQDLRASLQGPSATHWLGTDEFGRDILSRSRDYLQSNPHTAIFPGVAVALAVLGFNLLGDGLRDALDTRLRM